ncbi:RNA polymerase sigma factor, sigma-70 family [Singulisphaera sp. GP187]|uniref:sigma-70 family RNA polymerase sigma factor n=1 Tax=Singulisphaera sp. GP187 TaxID=1882752 RepID=UPI0009260AEB|nr:sigma-70 family RNA polymerase sigma factor [Singulisphaera sp. GP187]SIN81995.1 RNA polymerase sigma factor, sigma-70 family [Singulisphaera sp. GP187]
MPRVPQQIGRLFAEGTLTGLSDAELLGLFASGRDALAFDALVARHGPMVLGVCRGLLSDPNDAEDAFQATFLILVRKAGTIRGPVALGGWLCLAARRVAIRANVAAARRRAYERRAAQMAPMTSEPGPSARDELLNALHEEIARLPKKSRSAVVLCDLQGTPHDRASAELRLSERTLRRRLSEGRERLRTRLAGRGLGQDRAMLASLWLREARVTVPAAWRGATVRAALAVFEPAAAVGTVSATAMALTREVSRTMSLQKLPLVSAVLATSCLLVWGASAALYSPGPEATKQGTGEAQAPAVPKEAEVAVPPPRSGLAASVGMHPIRGRVLDPDGKPVPGAGVYVRPYAEPRWSEIDPMAARQKGRVAATGADGRFHFELDKGASDGSYYSGVTGWHKAQIAVAAPGFAPAWVEVGDMVKRGDMALRLVRDDVPVRGRVLNPQGRPVAGVLVRIRAIWEVNDGVDLDALLVSGAVDEDVSRMARRYGNSLGSAPPTWQADPTPLWPGSRNAWTTGADGRFEVRGIGRDRIARLEFHGGGVADGTLDVMARPAKAPPRARSRPSLHRELMSKDRDAAFNGLYPQGTQLVGATFDYIAGPTKPLVGVVRLKGSGKPVEGAIVRGADPGTHTAVTAQTDAAGHFRLDGIPKGEFYRIQVNPRQGIDSFLRRWELIDDTEGLKPLETTIEVPPGVIVTGRLIDKVTGRVVPPADVEYTKALDNVANGDSLGFSRLADAAFGLTVPPGRGMIAGAAAVEGKDDPYAAAHLKAADRKNQRDDNVYAHQLVGHHIYRFIDVPAGSGPVTMDLELVCGQSRVGRLIDPDGRLVVGAAAYGLSARDWSGTGNSRALDADTFEVGGLEPGHPRLLVFTHGTRKLVGAAVLKDEDLKSHAPLEVKLFPAGAITGRLLDDDGLPWAGATLDVWMSDPDRPSGAFGCSFGEKVTADAQGRFRVEAFVPGVETEVTIAVPNRWGVQLDGGNALRKPALKSGELRDLGDVKAKEIHQQ